MAVERQKNIPAIILAMSCTLAWGGNALYALGSPDGSLKAFSPAIVVLGSILFFGWHCGRRYGRKLTLLFMFSVFAIGWAFETLSVLTSVPFGQFHYTEIMAPFIGHVPVFVLPAYLFMGYAAWSMATLFLGIRRSRLSAEQARKIPPLAAFFMLLWDISMDPLRATIEGRWIWIDGGTYLGVPLSNFAGWFLVTWCMFSLFAYFIRRFPPVGLSRPETAKSFWVAIPIMYACYAGEYLLNPFTGHGLTMQVVGYTEYTAQHIFSIVAMLTALTIGTALISGFYIALRQSASKRDGRWSAHVRTSYCVSSTMKHGALFRDSHTDPRSKAEAVEQKLVDLTGALQSLPFSDPGHIHVLFAELYLLSTRNWLSRLAGRQDSSLAYRVIPIFYNHYRNHVLDQLDAPLETIAPHWRNYHRLARRLTLRSPISLHLLLISFGVRAHVHLDLGFAIHQVEAELALTPEEWASTHMPLFNQLSEEAFLAAALQYVESHRVRQTSWRRLILGLFRFGLVSLRPIWLKTLQRWRMQGYNRTSKIHMCANISQK